MKLFVAWAFLACLVLVGVAFAQSSKFPAANAIVANQGYASAAITLSDTAKIAVTRAIFNGNSTACNINMQLNGDSAAVIWQNVPSGAILPVQAILVKSTSTSCSNLIAIY